MCPATGAQEVHVSYFGRFWLTRVSSTDGSGSPHRDSALSTDFGLACGESSAGLLAEPQPDHQREKHEGGKSDRPHQWLVRSTVQTDPMSASGCTRVASARATQ